MRLGVDAWGLSGDLLNTGMGRYTANILRWIPETAGDLHVIAYGGPAEPRPPWLPKYIEWRPVGIKLPAKLTALHSRTFNLPAAVRDDQIDVFHAPSVHWRPLFPPVPLTDCALVVTLHDLIIFRYYDVKTLPRRQQIFAHWNLKRVLRADSVITVSEQSRAEIVDATHMRPERLNVIHNAVDFTPNPDPEPLRRLAVRTPYILYAGSFEPRKNLIGALRAYARIHADGYPHHLVAIVERQSGHRAAVIEFLDELRLPPSSVCLLHSLEDADLRSIYTHAEALFFPSFAEGFGYPPLQASACSVPVAASRLSILKETLGESAIYFDPHSIDEMASAMRSVLCDQQLRMRLRRAGPEQAGRFQPQPWIERHYEVYQQLYERKAEAGLSQRRTVRSAV